MPRKKETHAKTHFKDNVYTINYIPIKFVVKQFSKNISAGRLLILNAVLNYNEIVIGYVGMMPFYWASYLFLRWVVFSRHRILRD